MTLWLFAENRWSKKVRIILGLLVIVFSLPLTIIITFALTQINDNSYYTSAAKTIVSEAVIAIETNEVDFLTRLKELESSFCSTYENRQNLLNLAKNFKTQGERIRSEMNTVKTESAH